MMVLITLVLAAAAFYWILSPILGKQETIPQERSEVEMRGALERSVQELRTDLQLQKIKEEDLLHIEQVLEASAREK